MAKLKDEALDVYGAIRTLERDILTRVDVSCANSSDDAREDGVRRAREDVLALRALIDELKEIAEEAIGDERKEILDLVQERDLALESTRSIMRHAAMEAAMKERKREDDEREELLLRQNVASKLDNIKSQGAMAMSSEATDGLRRARQVMATELDKGERTLAVMTESTTTMERTGTEYSNQTTKLSSGRRLITTIERQTFMDRVILWTGFTLFILVVIHILWKRTPLLAQFHPMYQRAIKSKIVINQVLEDVQRPPMKPASILEPFVSDFGVEHAFLGDDGLSADVQVDPYQIPEVPREEL